MKVAATANLHHKAVSSESRGPKKQLVKSYEHALGSTAEIHKFICKHLQFRLRPDPESFVLDFRRRGNLLFRNWIWPRPRLPPHTTRPTISLASISIFDAAPKRMLCIKCEYWLLAKKASHNKVPVWDARLSKFMSTAGGRQLEFH